MSKPIVLAPSSKKNFFLYFSNNVLYQNMFPKTQKFFLSFQNFVKYNTSLCFYVNIFSPNACNCLLFHKIFNWTSLFHFISIFFLKLNCALLQNFLNLISLCSNLKKFLFRTIGLFLLQKLFYWTTLLQCCNFFKPNSLSFQIFL